MSVSAQPRRVPMSREQFLQLPEGPPYYDFELKNAPKNTPHHPRHRNTLFLPPQPLSNAVGEGRRARTYLEC